jgi:hypothetical protein
MAIGRAAIVLSMKKVEEGVVVGLHPGRVG